MKINDEPKMNFESLYSTINKIYNEKNPISRVLYVTKMKEAVSRDDKVARETTLNNLRDEIKKMLKKMEGDFNLMIIYIGTVYALVGIEVN